MMKEQERIEQARRALEKLPSAPEPNPLRQASARRAFLEQAARLRAAGGVIRPIPLRRVSGWLRAVTIFAVVLLSLGALTGVASAADHARPGDLLYPLDRTIEEIRLSAARDPASREALLLEFADERLMEAEQLASPGNEQHMEMALDAYDQIIADLARTVGSAGGADRQVLDEKLDQALSIHEQRLLVIRQRAPEQAWPGLDRAIEASRHSLEEGQPEGRPEKTPGPPEDKPDNSSHGHPDKTKTPKPTKNLPNSGNDDHP